MFLKSVPEIHPDYTDFTGKDIYQIFREAQKGVSPSQWQYNIVGAVLPFNSEKEIVEALYPSVRDLYSREQIDEFVKELVEDAERISRSIGG
jgi:hypothetical protein